MNVSAIKAAHLKNIELTASEWRNKQILLNDHNSYCSLFLIKKHNPANPEWFKYVYHLVYFEKRHKPESNVSMAEWTHEFLEDAITQYKEITGVEKI